MPHVRAFFGPLTRPFLHHLGSVVLLYVVAAFVTLVVRCGTKP